MNHNIEFITREKIHLFSSTNKLCLRGVVCRARFDGVLGLQILMI